jgi:hypothetical protein
LPLGVSTCLPVPVQSQWLSADPDVTSGGPSDIGKCAAVEHRHVHRLFPARGQPLHPFLEETVLHPSGKARAAENAIRKSSGRSAASSSRNPMSFRRASSRLPSESIPARTCSAGPSRSRKSADMTPRPRRSRLSSCPSPSNPHRLPLPAPNAHSRCPCFVNDYRHERVRQSIRLIDLCLPRQGNATIKGATWTRCWTGHPSLAPCRRPVLRRRRPLRARVGAAGPRRTGLRRRRRNQRSPTR